MICLWMFILSMLNGGLLNKLVLCQLQRQLALRLRNKSVISHLWQKIAHTPWHILKHKGMPSLEKSAMTI